MTIRKTWSVPGLELERSDACDDAGRSGKATPSEAFPEPQRSHQRGEQHRRFAQRGHCRDRRPRHRPQYDPVRREAARAADDSGAPAGAQIGHGGMAAAPDDPDDKRDAFEKNEPGDVARRISRRAGARAVDQRVGRNDRRIGERPVDWAWRMLTPAALHEWVADDAR